RRGDHWRDRHRMAGQPNRVLHVRALAAGERAMKFYIGLHQPSDARRFDRAFISVNRLRTRRKPVGAAEWIMDSGAFTEIAAHGKYRQRTEDYAVEVNRWARTEGAALVAAVSQD